MINLKTLRLFIIGFLLLVVALESTPQTVPTLHAQADGEAVCETLVRQAIREIGSTCRELGRDEACYGNTRVDAELTDPALLFAESGDIVGVETLTRLTTQPANAETGEWGIAVIDIRADLPENSDESVRLLMFGGLDIEPVPSGIDPDQPTCSVANPNAGNVNMRTGPSTDFAVVDSLRPGESLTGYGVNADGDWIRTSRGWISANVTTNDCADTDVVVIEETSDAYFAPMQNFTLSLGSGGACENAPTGLLIQSPDDTTANILINDVELRVGSTAFVTVTEEDDMLIGNLEGDVVVVVDGEDQPLNLGMATSVGRDAQGNPTTPTTPEPWGNRIDNLSEDLVDALPTPIDLPPMMPMSTGTNSTDNTSSMEDEGEEETTSTAGPGIFLGCRSCTTCGYSSDQCITTPDGQCVWDPALCQNAYPGFGGSAEATLSNPGEVSCISAEELALVTFRYASINGMGFLTNAEILDFIDVSVATDRLTVNLACPSVGQRSRYLVIATDSLGNTFEFTFTVRGE